VLTSISDFAAEAVSITRTIASVPTFLNGRSFRPVFTGFFVALEDLWPDKCARTPHCARENSIQIAGFFSANSKRDCGNSERVVKPSERFRKIRRGSVVGHRWRTQAATVEAQTPIGRRSFKQWHLFSERK
jgi:hypothetical protein